MMDKRPSKRPTAVEILQDPYIKRHMESLSHKLALTLMPSKKSNPSDDAKAIAEALKKKHRKVSSDSLHQTQERVMTPREKMLSRKTRQAEEQAEKLKQMAAENYSENQKRLKDQKSRKSKRIIPPWVEEHPDVFGDQTISLTAIELSRTEKLEDSMMELSLEKPKTELPIGDPQILYPPPPPPQSMSTGNDIPEDPMESDNYYSHFDDFEMIYSSSSDEENDYEAILLSINEALDLPEQVQKPIDVQVSPQLVTKTGGNGASNVAAATAGSSKQQSSHIDDDFSPFSPLGRDRRIAQLRNDAQRIYGEEVYQMIYRYLKIARGGPEGGTIDESTVIAQLKNITTNIRDCFLIDQLVFLEKQAEDSL